MTLIGFLVGGALASQGCLGRLGEGGPYRIGVLTEAGTTTILYMRCDEDLRIHDVSIAASGLKLVYWRIHSVAESDAVKFEIGTTPSGWEELVAVDPRWAQRDRIIISVDISATGQTDRWTYQPASAVQGKVLWANNEVVSEDQFRSKELC